jgi:LuxR family maltose regulon positive regulatory protein
MSAVYLAAAQRLRGSHRKALATARACLAWTDGHRAAVAGRVGLLHLIVGDLLLEGGDVAGALDRAEAGLASARLSALPPMLAYTLLGTARASAASGDPDRALAALDEAVELLPGASTADTEAGIAAPWLACRAQVLVRQGDLAPAEAWAAGQTGPPSTALLSGIRPGALAVAAGYECEHVRVAPAQVWLAVARARDDEAALRRAVTHVDAQRDVVASFGLGWLRVKLAVLRALALALGGDEERSVAVVRGALALAAPEGHVRLFAEEGQPMAALLTRARQAGARSGHATTYVDRLIAASASSPSEREAPAGALADPLSGRELEVLTLIASGQGNADIARTLYVAPSTVKTHVNHVFAKLGVASRTQAVARARELGLL